jgi:hypothetical protein
VKTLPEFCEERGVSSEVFNLEFLEAVMEWCRITGGYIPAFNSRLIPTSDEEKLRPTTERERTAISRHWPS